MNRLISAIPLAVGRTISAIPLAVGRTISMNNHDFHHY